MDSGQGYLSVQVPKKIIERIDVAAEKDHRNRSSFVRAAIIEKLERVEKEQLKQPNSTE